MKEKFQCFKKYLNGEGIFETLGCRNLPKNYTFKIPKSIENIGININEENAFAANLELKIKINEKWKKSSKSEKIQLAKWMVADWGGVRANSNATIEKYVLETEKTMPHTPFEGVSSYSKIFSAKDSKKYAILDARVIVSLLSVQLIEKSKSGIIFPFITVGRNKITGNSGTKTGFSYLPKYSTNQLAHDNPNWAIVEKKNCYSVYLDLLRDLSEISQFTISEIEMALFADAENLALKLEPSLSK